MKTSSILILLVLTCQILNAQELPGNKPVAPYSPAVLTSGGLLFISGQIPLEENTGKIMKGDIERETSRIMERIGAILKEHGMDYDDLVKCTVFLTDIRDYTRVNKVYGSYFNERFPAREAIEVSNLPLGASIEISGIASK